MTAPLSDLVAAIADQIRNALDAATTGTDLNFQVEPVRVLKPTPPTIDIYPADEARSDEGAGFGSVSGIYRFIIRARIDTAAPDAGQEILLDLMDDESDYCIAKALYDEPTLGGLATDVNIEAFTGHTIFSDVVGDGVFLGISWTVAVCRAYS